MLKNAEKTGSLTAALEELVLLLQRQQQLQKQLVAALSYPLLLLGFCLTIVFVLFFYIIPTLFDLLTGKNLPFFTRFVLNCSYFLQQHKFFLMSVFLGLVFSVIMLCVSKKMRHKGRLLLFYLPVIKTFFLKLAIVRFCRSFATLLHGGVAYLTALDLARQVMRHPFLEKELQIAEKRILEGQKLSDFLLANPHFPNLMARMLSIAQEMGNEEQMLINIAQIYEAELEKNLLRLTTFLQPVILLILGLIIGFIVLAILLPLTDVSSFI